MNVHTPPATAHRLPVLQSFIDELREIWRTDPDVGSCMEKARPLMEKVVRDPDLQARSADWPSTEGRKTCCSTWMTNTASRSTPSSVCPAAREACTITPTHGCSMASARQRKPRALRADR